jgi:hypothetical protein
MDMAQILVWRRVDVRTLSGGFTGVSNAVDFVFHEVPETADKGRPRWKRLGKILAIDAIVSVPIFLPLQVASDLNDAIEIEPCAAEDAAEVLVSAAGLVLEFVMYDHAILVGRRHAGNENVLPGAYGRRERQRAVDDAGTADWENIVRHVLERDELRKVN